MRQGQPPTDTDAAMVSRRAAAKCSPIRPVGALSLPARGRNVGNSVSGITGEFLATMPLGPWPVAPLWRCEVCGDEFEGHLPDGSGGAALSRCVCSGCEEEEGE